MTAIQAHTVEVEAAGVTAAGDRWAMRAREHTQYATPAIEGAAAVHRNNRQERVVNVLWWLFAGLVALSAVVIYAVMEVFG